MSNVIIEDQDDVKASAKSLRKRENRPHLFGPVPRPLAERPPRLAPIESAVMCAILREAYVAWEQVRHDAAFTGPGERAMARERARPIDDKHRQYKGMNVRDVGWDAYWTDKERLRLEGPSAPLIVKIKATRLLAVAGLANHSDNHHQLAEVLNRLTHDVGDMPPLLLKWTPMRRLRLKVNHEWLRGWHDALPLPLPIRSAPAIALLLLLLTLNWHSTTASMRLELVCELIGISMLNDRHAERRLRAVMKVLNAHLKTIPEACQRARVAGHYDFKLDEHGRVVFLADKHPKVVGAQERATQCKEQADIDDAATRMVRGDVEHARGIEEDTERESKTLERNRQWRKATKAEEHKDYVPPMNRPRLKKRPEPVDDDDDWRPRPGRREFEINPYD